MGTHRSSGYIFNHHGCTIHYWLYGPDNRPLVVFLHGAFVGHAVLAPQARIASQRFKVLQLDMRGHGKSRVTHGGFSVHQAAADLIALLDHIAVEHAVLVGLSLGAYVAQVAASMAESRISALVLIGCTGDRTFTLLNRAHIQAGLAVIQWAPEWLTRHALSYCSGKSPISRRVVRRELSRVSKSEMLQIARSSAEWALTHASVAPQSRAAQDSVIPHLIIRGQRDAYSIPGRRSWVRHRTDAKLLYVAVPRAGHLANLDNAEYFNEALLSFLAQCTYDVDLHTRTGMP
jgi:pimeloyl-ACP methyl ester carboxylesterase